MAAFPEHPSLEPSPLDPNIIADIKQTLANFEQPTLAQRIRLIDKETVKKLEKHLELPVTGSIQEMVRNYPTQHYTIRCVEYHPPYMCFRLAIRDGYFDVVAEMAKTNNATIADYQEAFRNGHEEIAEYLSKGEESFNTLKIGIRVNDESKLRLEQEIDFPETLNDSDARFRYFSHERNITNLLIILVEKRDLVRVKEVVAKYNLTREIMVNTADYHKTELKKQAILSQDLEIIAFIEELTFEYNVREYEFFVLAGNVKIYDLYRPKYAVVEDVEREQLSRWSGGNVPAQAIISKNLDMLLRIVELGFINAGEFMNPRFMEYAIEAYNLTFVDLFLKWSWGYDDYIEFAREKKKLKIVTQFEALAEKEKQEVENLIASVD